jgi:hypothetical protein
MSLTTRKTYQERICRGIASGRLVTHEVSLAGEYARFCVRASDGHVVAMTLNDRFYMIGE